MQTLLTEVGLITSYIVVHLHVDILIYSVMYTLPLTNDNVIYIYIYIYKTFVYSVLPEDG